MLYDLFEHLHKHDHKIAIRTDDRHITYKELLYNLKRIDLSSFNSRYLIIMLDDSIELILLFLGSMFAGKIPILLNPNVSKDAVSEIKLKFKADIVSSANIRFCTANTPRYKENSPFFLCTSGTTGKARLVKHEFKDLAGTGIQFNQITPIKESDIFYSASKISHAYGLGNSISIPFTNGSSVVLSDRISSSKSLSKIFTKHKVSIFCGVPRHFYSYIKSNHSSVRLCLSAGDRLSKELINKVKTPLIDAMGSTEVLGFYLSNCINGKFSDEFKHLPSLKYTKRMLNNGLYELVVKSPFSSNCCVFSGDVFDGMMYKGRKKDIVKINGLYVSLYELDKSILSIKGVNECICSIIVHNERTKLKISVVTDNRYSIDKISRNINSIQSLARTPYLIYNVKSIPKTYTGKPSRLINDASYNF